MTNPLDLDEGDEQAIAAFLSRVSELRVPNPESPSTSLGASRIPDSTQLWWKAQLLKKWEAERRAQWPLDVMQPIEIAGGLVAAGLLLYWSLPYLL